MHALPCAIRQQGQKESGTERTEHASSKSVTVSSSDDDLGLPPKLRYAKKVDWGCPPRKAARSTVVHRSSAHVGRMYGLMREARRSRMLLDVDFMPHWSSRRERTAPVIVMASLIFAFGLFVAVIVRVGER